MLAMSRPAVVLQIVHLFGSGCALSRRFSFLLVLNFRRFFDKGVRCLCFSASAVDTLWSCHSCSTVRHALCCQHLNSHLSSASILLIHISFSLLDSVHELTKSF